MNTLPTGPFSVVLADPPWRFLTYSAKGQGKSPDRHYSTMTMDEICALPVADVLEKDAALFMWATWPTIFAAQRVIGAWGFKYSGLAWEWLKYNPKTKKYAFGLGYGTRKNLEPCLLGRVGKPILHDRSIRDFLIAPRREHSRKPDEQYERIERMFHGPRLEMFARQEWPGWTAWGDDVERFKVAA
jgi:N6-adenosine-specific RNA methylase IME4